jgi:hypothetical protein
MKTQVNTQKKVIGQAKKIIIRGSIVIVGLVLISWTLSAQDFWKQMRLTNSPTEMTMLMVEDSPESEEVNAAISAIMNEWKAAVNKPAKVEVLNSDASRNAYDFIHAIESVTAQDVDRQIEKYADQLIHLQKNKESTDDFLHSVETINTQEAKILDDRYAEKQNKFIELK